MHPADPQAGRVLVLAVFAGDAALTARILTAHQIPTLVCEDVDSLCVAIHEGAGAIVLTEEALDRRGVDSLVRALEEQPPWSDLTVIVSLLERNAARLRPGLRSTLESRVNLTPLERPVRIDAMVGAVKCALRARRRQYQTRDILEELARSRAKAEEAVRTKDEFVATVSHELRTPLNAMLGWSRMLASGELDPARQRRAVEAIERNAVSQARLIEDLLDVSRMLAGAFRLETEPVDLTKVLEAAQEAVRPVLESKGIDLEVLVDPGVAPVLGDTQRLQQVFWNLLTNAAKFTPAGGRINLTVLPDESGVEITVKDTGEGILPEFLPHVFERFRQADGRITRVHGGLGLGLAIARHLVELHGGTIQAESAGRGQGAIFRVHLPSLAAPGMASAAAECRENRAAIGLVCPLELSGLRILVVDDDPDALTLASAILETCGSVTTTAGSAEEAMGKIHEGSHDALVSDLGMPGEDGFSLIQRIRALPDDKAKIPAMALTAYARVEDRKKALGAGFQMHVAKPVEPTELIDAVAELVRRGKWLRPTG